jgi:hypothetical protein
MPEVEKHQNHDHMVQMCIFYNVTHDVPKKRFLARLYSYMYASSAILGLRDGWTLTADIRLGKAMSRAKMGGGSR